MSDNQKCDHVVCDDNGKLLRASDVRSGRFNDMLDLCPTCLRCEEEIVQFAYCPTCGAAINWNDISLRSTKDGDPA